MARKGGKRGGSSAARSAAAKKGWETRRRGGAKAKPAATKRTAASKAKPTAKRGGMPKTTSARGRALTNQRRAADLVRASRGGKGPSAKAVRSVLTAQRARAFYAATGGGKKRSAVKVKSAAKVGKSIRAEGRAKVTAARAKVAGRPRSRVVAKPAAQRLSGMGRAPATRLPAANSDAYKYNKAGLLASPQERLRMRGRDRAREKNAALAQQQAAGQRRAERQAARRLTSDRTQPMSVLRNSPTFNAAERAVQRRSRRADENFRQSFQLERQKSALTSKALKMQQQAAERKAQGKKVTQTMESNFQQLRRQLAKVDRSLATRRRAIDVVRGQSERMTINTRERSRY